MWFKYDESLFLTHTPSEGKQARAGTGAPQLLLDALSLPGVTFSSTWCKMFAPLSAFHLVDVSTGPRKHVPSL